MTAVPAPASAPVSGETGQTRSRKSEGVQMTTESALLEALRKLPPAGIIDCYANANPPTSETHWERVDYLFHNARSKHGDSAEALVASMDEHGITKALLAPPPDSPDLDQEAGYRWTLQTVQRYPERFRLSVRVDPHEGMQAVRKLENMVHNDGGVALRLVPLRIGKPLDDRIYFPLYTKCCELGVPITATVGIPGPRVPGMLQHPKYLDDLCYLWPELTIVTTHGGEPWTALLVKLMAKWPNLYHMISAFAPKYYPADTIHFLNSSHGRRKVMFATDYPLVSFERAAAELPGVGIAEKSWPYFLYKNAEAIFWDGTSPDKQGQTE